MAPTPGFNDGNGATAPSRSAIIGGSATGHHLLDIEGYSHIRDHLPTGQCIKSRPFTVGAGGTGTSWRILFYPNGVQPDVSEFISVFLDLDLDQAVAEPVEAQAKFSLLDQTGSRCRRTAR